MPAAAGTCSIRPSRRGSHTLRRRSPEQGPFVAASDYVRGVPEQLDPWVPGGLYVLGTDGFGRSESRPALRRFFEVDAECITIAALTRLADQNQFDRAKIATAIHDLGIDPEKSDPFAS